MALQTTFISDQNGLVINGAYARIQGFHGTKDIVRMDVETFVSQQARLEGKQPITITVYEVSLPIGDILPALYTYLKTLPEFANAIDV